MNPDSLNLSQREALDAQMEKQMRKLVNRQLRTSEQLDDLSRKAVAGWVVAFVAACCAAILAMLLVRSRAGL